jgi:hypothetical protein
MSFNPGGGGIANANDVALSNPATGNGLVFNSGLGKWQNSPVANPTDVSDSQAASINSSNTYTDTKFSQAPLTIYYGTGAVPSRTAYTTDGTRVVFWIGQAQPAIGGTTGAVDNLDIWFRMP